MKSLCYFNSNCIILTILYEHEYLACSMYEFRMYCTYDFLVYIVCVMCMLMIPSLFLLVSFKSFHLLFAVLFSIFCQLMVTIKAQHS